MSYDGMCALILKKIRGGGGEGHQNLIWLSFANDKIIY